MKKLLYCGFVLMYVGVGILGMIGTAYSEIGGTSRIINHNLVLIISIAVLIGLSSNHIFPKWFLKAYNKLNSFGKTGIAVVFILIVLILTIGTFRFINVSFGKIELISVNGVIEKKWLRKMSKSNEYYIGIRDTITGKYYEFVIRKQIYELTGDVGDKIVKDFYRGSLGVIYRDRL